MRTFQFFTGALGVAIAGVIFYLIRRDHMHARFSLWWLVVGVLAVVVGFFPRWVDAVGGWLGVSYPPVLGLIVAVAALVLKILMVDLEQSRTRREMLRLTQRVLLVEEQLRKAREINSREAKEGNHERNG